MKNLLIAVILMFTMSSATKQTLKPYILGATSTKSIAEVENLLNKNLKSEGFKIVGSYAPEGSTSKKVICVSSSKLIAASQKIGGLTALASVLRVALTKEGSVINISYTNPFYWGNAYYREDYSKVEANYKAVFNMFIRAMKKSGTFKGQYFGAKKGVEIDDLQDYQYMMGMQDFDDVVELGEFASFEEAVKVVEKNLSKNSADYAKVYAQKIPGKNLKVYGVALTGKDGEKSFMPKIDITSPKHTAFLPYEILVQGKKVIMLHGRFRIAVSFPDLTMGTFSKIMSTPGNIEDVMEKLCEK